MRIAKQILAFALTATLTLGTMGVYASATSGGQALTQAQIDAARHNSTLCVNDYCYTMAIKSGNTLDYWGKTPRGAHQTLLTGVLRADEALGTLWVLKTDGSLWEYNTTALANPGLLGPATDTTPQKIFDGVKDFSGDMYFVAAILSDGSLWSANFNLVQGDSLPDGSASYAPVVSAPNKVADGGILHVSVGNGALYVIKADNALYRWNFQDFAQQNETPGGRSYTTYHPQGEPEKVMDNVAWVSAKDNLLIDAGNNLWGWGRQYLRDAAQSWDSMDDRNSDVTYSRPALLIENVAKASVGPRAGIALKTDGSIWTWGNTDLGALGNGVATVENRSAGMVQHTPVQIVSSGGRDVAAGMDHNVYLLSDGSLWGMGNNDLQPLGAIGGNFKTSYGAWVQTVPAKIAGGCLIR